MPSILSFIAEQEQEKVFEKNIVYDPTIDFLYPAQTIIFPDIIPVNEDLLTIGQNRLEETQSLNLFLPEDGYNLTDLSNIDANIIDTPEIKDYLTDAYNYINAYNNYAQIDNSFIRNIPEPNPVIDKIDNYDEYISPILSRYQRCIPSFLDHIENLVGEDTPIGEIAKIQLKENVYKNLEQNIFQESVGRLNTDIFGLIDGESFIREDFTITKPRTLLGQGLNLSQKLLGIQLPFCIIPSEAFSLYSNDFLPASERVKLLLDYSGKAYKNIIINNSSINEYYHDVEGNENVYYFVDEKRGAFSGLRVVFGGGDTYIEFDESYSYPKFKDNKNLNPNIIGIPSLGIDNLPEINSIWGIRNENRFNEKSLLYETKKIFALSNDKSFVDQYAKFFIDQSGLEDIEIAKGSTITSYQSFVTDDGVNIDENDYFRIFTKERKYNKLSTTLRHRALDINPSQSVLGNNGIPIYAPTINESLNRTYKKYMFSISNMAWKGNSADIPLCERYVDVDGSIGRQMWFAPYDLKISETVSPTVNETTFFGRNEPIYTLSSTKRSVSLSFALIVDHPDIVNRLKGQYNHIWERYFKGDKSVYDIVQSLIDNRLSPSDQEKINNLKESLSKKNWNIDDPVKDDDSSLNDYGVKISDHYYPNETVNVIINDNSLVTLNGGYENGDGIPLGYTYLNGRLRETKEYIDRTDNGLNSDFFNTFPNKLYYAIISEIQAGNKEITINVVGFASAAISSRVSNNVLSKQRAELMIEYIQGILNGYDIYNVLDDNQATLDFVSFSEGDQSDNITNESSFADDINAKTARRVDIYISSSSPNNSQPTIEELQASPNYADIVPIDLDAVIDNIDNNINVILFGDKCNFFKELEVNNPLFYNSISQKIDYFSPAFHSYTPQNFNERLTFLHQCTRSANNIGINGNEPTNLFYGYQPIVYISLGDWFKSKAIITSLNIDYNAYDLIWDTNPESGVGVQPMFANVSVNLEIIGGQSMTGALNRLQNALSFNYYANTENYDYRSDKIFNYVEDGKLKSKILDGKRRSEIIPIDKLENAKENLRIAQEQGLFNDNTLINDNPNIVNADDNLFNQLLKT